MDDLLATTVDPNGGFETVDDIPLINRIAPITGILIFLAAVVVGLQFLWKRCFADSYRWKNTFFTESLMFDDDDAEAIFMTPNLHVSKKNSGRRHHKNSTSSGDNLAIVSFSTEMKVVEDPESKKKYKVSTTQEKHENSNLKDNLFPTDLHVITEIHSSPSSKPPVNNLAPSRPNRIPRRKISSGTDMPIRVSKISVVELTDESSNRAMTLRSKSWDTDTAWDDEEFTVTSYAVSNSSRRSSRDNTGYSRRGSDEDKATNSHRLAPRNPSPSLLAVPQHNRGVPKISSHSKLTNLVKRQEDEVHPLPTHIKPIAFTRKRGLSV